VNRVYPKGRCPAEVQPVCHAINTKDSIVYFSSWDRSLKAFDFNGNFVTSITKPINPEESLPPWYIAYCNNTLFVAVAQMPWVKYIYSCYDIKWVKAYFIDWEEPLGYCNIPVELSGFRKGIIKFLLGITENSRKFPKKS